MKKTNTDLIDLYTGAQDEAKVAATDRQKSSARQQSMKKTTVHVPAKPVPYVEEEHTVESLVADPVVEYMSVSDLKSRIEKVQSDMTKAAKAMDFMEAARLRDELIALKDLTMAKEVADV